MAQICLGKSRKAECMNYETAAKCFEELERTMKDRGSRWEEKKRGEKGEGQVQLGVEVGGSGSFLDREGNLLEEHVPRFFLQNRVTLLKP